MRENITRRIEGITGLTVTEVNIAVNDLYFPGDETVDWSESSGIASLTRSAAREWGRQGITANAIAPGPIETPLLMAAKQLGEIGEKIIETMKSGTQMKRLGQPEEVAATVAFLCSDDSSYVTGECIGVSGGMGMVG